MKKLFLLLVFPSLVLCQPLTLNDVVWSQRQVISSLLPDGMSHRWRASDLNSSPVSIWTDSIQGYNWTASGSARPTWDTNGVTFNGSNNDLAVTNIISSTVGLNQSWLVVLKLSSTTSGQGIMSQAASGGEVFLATDTGGKLYSANYTIPGGLGISTFDLLTAKVTNAVPYTVFTNGVSLISNGFPFNDSVTILHVGSYDGASGFGSFVLKEAIQWTNVIWTVDQVSNVHYYVTNTYGVTP